MSLLGEGGDTWTIGLIIPCSMFLTRLLTVLRVMLAMEERLGKEDGADAWRDLFLP